MLLLLLFASACKYHPEPTVCWQCETSEWPWPRYVEKIAQSIMPCTYRPWADLCIEGCGQFSSTCAVYSGGLILRTQSGYWICRTVHGFRRPSKQMLYNWLIHLFIYLPSDLYRYGSSQSHTDSYIKENRSVQNICHNNILQANLNTNNMSKLCYMLHNNL